MTRHKAFDDHGALIAAFGERLAGLTDEEWRKLSASCAHLNSSSFSALLERTRLGARPYELSFVGAQTNLLVAAIGGVSKAMARCMSFAYEIGREFDTEPPWIPPTRTTPSNEPHSAIVDAHFAIERAVGPREQAEPGLAVAVRAAGQALLYRKALAPDDFIAAYRYLEPIIPFASLTPA